MITALLVWWMQAHAGTLTEAETALWKDPTGQEARLAFAEALASTPGREEEAVEALRQLLWAPDVGAAAREVLGEIARHHPPRRGWDGVYAELAEGPDGPAKRAARVRIAQLQATTPSQTPKARKRALAELAALAAAGEPLADVALGDVDFEAGDTQGARSAWLRAPDAVAAQRVAIAALTLDAADEAEAARARALAAGARRADGLGESFTVAVTTGSAAAKARALIEAGFPNAAERVLLHALGAEGAEAAAVAGLLGDMRLERGDGVGAASAYTEALTRDPTPERRAALVWAQLASGRPDDATTTLGTGPVPAADRGALEATLGFVRALATSSPDDDLPAGAAAFAGAPDAAGTAATYGRLLVAAGRDADAVAPLAAAVRAHPEDGDARGLLIGAAVRAKDARALDAASGAVAHAPGTAARQAALDTLAGLLLAAADAQKAAGAPATARTSVLVALAVRPDAPAVLHAVAGLLWAEGAHAAALALYARAATLDPADVPACAAAAQLSLALGRTADAELWLATLPADAPEARALRDLLAREDDARAARVLEARKGALEDGRAEAEWKRLLAKWPGDARFQHGLADVYQRLGRLEESLAIHRAAAKAAPADPWNGLGVAQALFALGRRDEALAALDALPATLPTDAARERDRIRAQAARQEGDRARAAGDLVAARTRYETAYALDPDVWTAIALAGTLVAMGDAEAGLARFREVTAAHPDDAEIDAVATRGEAGALEASGQPAAALAVLDALAARRPDPETDRQREETRARVAVGAADALRRDGKYADAERALQALVLDVGNQPMVQAAWAALLLDLHRPADAVAAANRALLNEPNNRWALDVARQAGRACRCSARVVPLFRVALASGGDPALRLDLRRVEVAAATEAALESRRDRRPLDARDAMRRADELAGSDAAALVVLADGERAFGRPGRARDALERAHAIDPTNVDALLGLADDLAGRGRWRAAVALLDGAWTTSSDARVGAALAALRADPPRAWRGEGVPVTPPGVPVATPVPRVAAAPPAPLPRNAGPIATAGFGVLQRAGVAGVGKELATYVPLHVGPPTLGPVQLDIEAVLLRVENGVDTRYGVAPSVGFTTPPERPWAAWARIGTSPLGFDTDAYPVWHLGARGRVGAPLAFGVETGRAPVLDSYASWVGADDLYTGAAYGRVHHTWLGGWAGVGAPWGTDVGALGRLGQSEGIGLAPVGRAEVVTWVGQRIGTPANNVRIGAEGVAFSHQYQVDGFQSGQGAFYSPPIFGVATGRVDVRVHALQDRLGVCFGGGAGMQYAGGGTSLYFLPGSAFTHNGRFSVEWNVSGAWSIAVQGGWLTAGPWHQETGLVRFGHHLGGPPPLTTFATPAAGLLYQGEPC